MTHPPGPACVQCTQQERDADPKKVTKVVRMAGEILGFHDVRVRIMGHDSL
jgi:hypothetical protein